MTVTIPIAVSGDVWYNRLELQHALAQLLPDQTIVLNFRAEGPSIHRLGISTVLDDWLAKTNRPPTDVVVMAWSNATESIDYAKMSCSVPSHFWRMSQDYWQHATELPSEEAEHRYLFGLFLGRSTVSRNVILYQTYHQWPGRVLLSRMKNLQPEPWHLKLLPGGDAYVPEEKLEDWLSPQQQTEITAWFDTLPISSIDHKTVKDQFGDVANNAKCAVSLLEHYNRFNIEIVCETYTLGTTFFPTEKTVRPIQAAKPWLIYGPVDFLTELQNMGFETYHELWDESYDQLEGAARWQAMSQVIDQLTALPQKELRSMLDQAHNIAWRNRMHLCKLHKTLP